MQMREVMASQVVPLIKTVQHSITNISRNIKAVFFKLGTRNEHHKRKKMTLVVLLPQQQLYLF